MAFCQSRFARLSFACDSILEHRGAVWSVARQFGHCHTGWPWRLAWSVLWLGSFNPAVPGPIMAASIPCRPVSNNAVNAVNALGYISRRDSVRARTYAHHICSHCEVDDNNNLVGRVSDLSYGLSPSDSFFIEGVVIGEVIWVGEWRFRGRLCFNSGDLCRPVAVRGWWENGWTTVTVWELSCGGLISSAR